MKRKGNILLVSLLLLLTAGLLAFTTNTNAIDDQILSYTVDTKTQGVELYWKNDNGETLKSIQNLKNYVERKSRTLTFRTCLESCAACMACENRQLLFADPEEVAGYTQ